MPPTKASATGTKESHPIRKGNTMTYEQDDEQIPGVTDDAFDEVSDTGTLEYVATLQELAEAGIGDGFSIRHIDRMPEHESEFVSSSALPITLLEDELQALNDQLNTASCYGRAI